MKQIGISIFTGMEYSISDNLNYMKEAAELGFTMIFTSLQRLGSDFNRIQLELPQVSKEARRLGFDIVSDVNPSILQTFGSSVDDLSSISGMGITAIRLDYGFSIPDVVKLASNKHGIKIELNACNKFEVNMKEFVESGAVMENFQASFNYYPRFESGISIEFLEKQSKMFHDFNVPVFAFVSSSERHTRVTVEELRYSSPSFAAELLFATSLIDGVLIGDTHAPKRDLEAVSRVGKREHIVIRVVPRGEITPKEKELLFGRVLTSKPGTGLSMRHVGRVTAEELGKLVPPRNCVSRVKHSICLDNLEYREGNNQLTGSWEINIPYQDLPADPRVNVIGDVYWEDRPLVSQIKLFGKYELELIH